MSERKCWTVAVGNYPGPFASRKVKRSARKAFDYISGLEGLVGFHPHYPDGTLCLFESENHAKRARNLMNGMGIQTGNNICEVFIDEARVRDPIETSKSE